MSSFDPRAFAPVVLRLSLAAVVLWFGFSQLADPHAWTDVVPSWATPFGIDPTAVVYLNGFFETAAGFMLGVGAYVRLVAFLLSLHLFVIAAGFGVTPIGVRDFGLACCLFSVSLFGEDAYSFSYHE